MDKYFATRYDSARDEVVALLSDEGEGYGRRDGMTGDVDSPTGSIQLVHLDATCDLDFADHTNYPPGDEVGELARTYGVTADDVTGSHIVTYNAQGFVYVDTFDTREQAQERFDCLAGRYAEWSDRGEDDESEVYVCPGDSHGYHEV